MNLSDWLALREPADAAARSAALSQFVADALPRNRPLNAIDLGAGSGSNIGYLASRLPARQQWLAVDDDEMLLAEIPSRMARWTHGPDARMRVETRRLNLGAADHPEIFSGRDLVTASALLDLVSERWLEWLAAQCSANNAAVLFAL